jgi:hypothetical protein
LRGETCAGDQALHSPEIRGEGTQHEIAVRKHVMQHEEPRVRSKLLVEEILDLERAPALVSFGWIQRRLGKASLERLDDPGRISDRLPIQDEHWKRPATGQLFRDRLMAARHGGATNVGHPLVVERPARLLVVVGDLQVPEHGSVSVVCAVAAHLPPAHTRHGSRPGSSPPATMASRSK